MFCKHSYVLTLYINFVFPCSVEPLLPRQSGTCLWCAVCFKFMPILMGRFSAKTDSFAWCAVCFKIMPIF